MTLAIPIPDHLDPATVRGLDQVAREAVGVQLYRERKLSHGKLAKFLGIGRGEVDDLLSKHGVMDLTTGDLQRETQVIRQRLGMG